MQPICETMSSVLVNVEGEPDEVLSFTHLRERSAQLLRDYANVGGLVLIRDRWGRDAGVLVIFGDKTGRPGDGPAIP